MMLIARTLLLASVAVGATIAQNQPFITYGSGCPGTGGFAPTLSGDGDVTPGTGTLLVQLANGPGGAPATVFLGLGRSALPLPGFGTCQLLLSSVLDLTFPPQSLAGTGPGNGTATWSIPLPFGLDNGMLNLQGVVVDFGIPQPIDVTVTNGLEVRFPRRITTLHVEPRLVASFVDTPVRIHVDQLALESPVAEVGITDTATSNTTILATPPQDPADADVTLVTIPNGLPDGVYDVEVRTATGSRSTLPSGLVVTSTLSLGTLDVSPGALEAGAPHFVEIRTDDPPAPGNTGLLAGARFYLASSSMPAGPATMLSEATFVSTGLARAVLPASLAIGIYDLVAVNPDGSVGVSIGAITVAATTPEITGVTPAALTTSSFVPVTVSGSGFTPGAAISLRCLDPNGMPVLLTPAVTASTATSIDLIVDTSPLTAGTICVLELVDPSGAVAAWSALTVKGPANNLPPWRSDTSLIEARRAPATAIARSGGHRFAYAVGGDTGTPASARTSVEVATLDEFGRVGPWSLLPSGLPQGRTLTDLVASSGFVYLPAGHDGSAPTAALLRARVLEPLDAPRPSAVLQLEPTSGSGLSPGLWQYAVSATFGPSDATNPNGESLPSEVVSVTAPGIPGADANLTWPAIPGASGYRGDPTPSADLPATTLELLATVASPSFTDSGGSTAPTDRPLPAGALGAWHDTGSSMATARSEHGVALAPDPDDAGASFLYVAGGLDSLGNALSSIEYARIAADGSVSAWSTATPTLGSARSGLSAWVTTASESSAVSGSDAWLYLGPGRGATGSFDRRVEATLVSTTGDLGSLSLLGNTSRSLGNYIAISAIGSILLQGGISGSASSLGISATYQPPAPGLGSWNSTANPWAVARSHASVATASVFALVIGGSDGMTALSSTESTSR